MITKETLQPFCSDDVRPSLARPWTLPDGFTYASDGRIAVKVTALPDVPPNSDAPKTMDNLGFAFEQDFEPLPPIPDAVIEDCGECDGSGMYECGNCTCDNCGGKGTIVKRVAIKIGTRLLIDIYLRKIAALPSPVMIGVTGDSLTPARFTFDGGEGLIMPMREP